MRPGGPARVPRLVYLSDAAGPYGGEDLVRTQAGTGREGMKKPGAL